MNYEQLKEKQNKFMKSLSTDELTAIAWGKLKIGHWTCTNCSGDGFQIVPNTPTTASSTAFDGCEHCPNFADTKMGNDILAVLKAIEDYKIYKKGG